MKEATLEKIVTVKIKLVSGNGQIDISLASQTEDAEFWPYNYLSSGFTLVLWSL